MDVYILDRKITLNFNEELCHERGLVRYRDGYLLDFASGRDSAEVWRANLNGSDPSGDG
jgi:hypothetical protein